MFDQFLTFASNAMPLNIRGATCSEALHLYGDAWNFYALSPWRITDSRIMIVGSEDENVAPYGPQLIGLSIVEVKLSSNTPIDPIFILSNGWQIEVFAVSAIEPWRMKLPNTNLTYVAAPTSK